MVGKQKFFFYVGLFGILTLFAVFSRVFLTPQFTPAEVSGAPSGLELFVQPEAGRKPILDLIDSAGKEVLVEVYLLSDKEVIKHLKEAHDRGMNVQVLLEEHPFGGGNLNQNTFKELVDHGVAIKWSNPTFALTHEKAIVVDRREACILNQNLTAAAFTKNREFDICTTDVSDVNEVVGIFGADWLRAGYSPAKTNLVVSPETARGKLETLVSGASKSLDIYMEVVDDQEILTLLKQKASAMPVKMLFPTEKQVPANKTVVKRLTEGGVRVRFLSSPYVHAKMILADDKVAYVGSVNLTTASLDQNRELGILVSQADIVDQIKQTFEEDWKKAAE